MWSRTYQSFVNCPKHNLPFWCVMARLCSLKCCGGLIVRQLRGHIECRSSNGVFLKSAVCRLRMCLRPCSSQPCSVETVEWPVIVARGTDIPWKLKRTKGTIWDFCCYQGFYFWFNGCLGERLLECGKQVLRLWYSLKVRLLWLACRTDNNRWCVLLDQKSLWVNVEFQC